jgi:hypothetical protein
MSGTIFSRRRGWGSADTIAAAGVAFRTPSASVADLVVRAPLANRDTLAELDGYLPNERRTVRHASLVDGLTALQRRLYRESLASAIACARAFEAVR